jgi:hypothetical protein
MRIKPMTPRSSLVAMAADQPAAVGPSSGPPIHPNHELLRIMFGSVGGGPADVGDPPPEAT